MGRSQSLPRGGDPRFGPDADDTGCPILHVDMDAFFASVEVRRRPELRGRPVVVGGDRPARGGQLGQLRGPAVRRPQRHADRCGPGRSARTRSSCRRTSPQYTAASRAVMRIFRDVTPLVEPLSLDEAFLDVAGARRLLRPPGRDRPADPRAGSPSEQGLTCSVGVAPTQVRGQARLHPGQAGRPAGRARRPGARLPAPAAGGRAVGGGGARRRDAAPARPATVRRPRRGAARHAAPRAGRRRPPAHLHELAWGRDPRRVSPEQVEKSIGAEVTFDTDVADPVEIRRALLRPGREGRRPAARRRARSGGPCRIKVRLADFRTVSRSRTLGVPTDVAREMFETAWALSTALRPGEPDPAGRRPGGGARRGRGDAPAAHPRRARARLAGGGGRGRRRGCPIRAVRHRSGQSAWASAISVGSKIRPRP